jgi:hypothetical protein
MDAKRMERRKYLTRGEDCNVSRRGSNAHSLNGNRMPLRISMNLDLVRLRNPSHDVRGGHNVMTVV